MSNLLRQSDVDNLLAALLATQESGVVGRGRTLSEVKIYDFAQPENIPSEIVRVLESLNAFFARSLSAMLTASMGEPVQIEPLSAEQMTFRQFCHAIPEVTTAASFTVNQTEWTSLLELNPHLAWYFVDRGLGGDGEILTTSREFTALERGMLEDLFRRILRELAKAWENASAVTFELIDLITTPSTAHIAQPDDRMIVCSFGIRLEKISGMSYYAIPISCLDFDRLLSGAGKAANEGEELTPEQESRLIADRLMHIMIEVRACFPEMPILIGELADLRQGDVIQLAMGIDDTLALFVNDESKFTVRPLNNNAKVGVEIIDEIVEEGHE